MAATFEIPEPLFERLTNMAARRGQTTEELVTEILAASQTFVSTRSNRSGTPTHISLAAKLRSVGLGPVAVP